ncbi:MAG: flippase [Thermoanaerobaculia bacterium]
MSSTSPDTHSTSSVKPLAGGAAVLLVGRTGARSISYILQMVLGRLLGPASYGLYAVGWNLLLIVGLAASLGLEHGVIRFGADLSAENGGRLRRVTMRSLKIAALAGGVAAAVLWLLAPWLAESVFDKPGLRPVLAVMAAALLFMPALRVAAASLRAALRMVPNVIAEDLVQPLVNLVLFLVFWALGWHLFGALVATVVSFAVALLAALAFLARGWWRQAEPVGEVAVVGSRELMLFSLPAALAGMLALVTMWIDRLLVAYFLTAADTGIYQAASQVAFIFILILNSFNGIFAPLIAGHFAAGRKQELNDLYKVSTKWGLYLALPVFLVIVIAPDEVLGVLLDSRYVVGALPLVVLSIAQVVNLATGAVGFILVMGGRQNSWLLLSGAALTVNIGLSLFLIPRHGLIGAAVAALLSIVGLFGSALLLVRRWEDLWPWDRRYVKGLVAALVTAGALVLTDRLPIGSPVLHLLALCVVAVVVFAGVLRVMGPDPEDREVMQLVRGKLGSGPNPSQ